MNPDVIKWQVTKPNNNRNDEKV